MADVDPELVRRVGVFSTLTPEQRARIVEVGTITEHATGDALTQEGVIGHRFRLLLDGRGVVERGGSPIATVAAGDFVGEIALLGGGRYTATVRCTDPTRCLTIDREPFWSLLETEPAIALRILEVVCRRTEQLLGPTPTANLTGAWAHVEE